MADLDSAMLRLPGTAFVFRAAADLEQLLMRRAARAVGTLWSRTEAMDIQKRRSARYRERITSAAYLRPMSRTLRSLATGSATALGPAVRTMTSRGRAFARLARS